jgi:hypothetical protein
MGSPHFCYPLLGEVVKMRRINIPGCQGPLQAG